MGRCVFRIGALVWLPSLIFEPSSFTRHTTLVYISNYFAEFGAVYFEIATGRMLEEFHRFVRPAENRTIHPYVASMTGITQAQVDGGISFAGALNQLKGWIQSRDNCIIITWSDNDLGVILKRECGSKHVPFPGCLTKWCDLQQVVAKKYNRTMTLEDALQTFDLPRYGNAHSALPDAKALVGISQKFRSDICITSCI